MSGPSRDSREFTPTHWIALLDNGSPSYAPKMLNQREVGKFVDQAIECSVYIAPNSPGLTYAELFQVGQALNYKQGEIEDAVSFELNSGHIVQYGPKLEPGERINPLWELFSPATDPDYRNLAAFDYVSRELRDISREMRARNAK